MPKKSLELCKACHARRVDEKSNRRTHVDMLFAAMTYEWKPEPGQNWAPVYCDIDKAGFDSETPPPSGCPMTLEHVMKTQEKET